MKHIIKISLVVSILVVTLLSCRHDGAPEDIHEHEEIEKLVVTLTNKNDTSDKQIIQYIGGISDKSIELKTGATYAVTLDFQVKHDDHYHSVNEEILEEKEEHFVTFEFSNSDVEVTRTNADEKRTDGNLVGIQTEWKFVGGDANGKIGIKLVHMPSSIEQNFPSATNQQGKTNGGESDVNALINWVKK